LCAANPSGWAFRSPATRTPLPGWPAQRKAPRYEGEAAAADGAAEIEVLECNWNAVQVFANAQATWLSGMRAAYLGISAAEIHAAALLLRVPRGEWPQLLRDVRTLDHIAPGVRAGRG
jgi:hypothetical protein